MNLALCDDLRRRQMMVMPYAERPLESGQYGYLEQISLERFLLEALGALTAKSAFGIAPWQQDA
jgi:hypothetical protein